MKTWNEILDALNARTGLSDRKLGVMFGLGEGAVAAWRTGRGLPDDAKALRMAELLDLDPAYIVAVINAERAARAKDKAARAMWQRVADAFGKAAMLAVLSAAPFMAPSPAQAGFNNNVFCSGDGNTHWRRKKPRRWCDVGGAR